MSFNDSQSSRQAWVDFLSERPFSMFVTWKFPKIDPFEDRSQFECDSIKTLDKYYMFVSKRIFGKKALSDKTKALRQVTFFERESKFGGYTILHAHALIEASPENYDRTARYLVGQWKKFKPYKNSPDPFIKKIEGIRGVSWYVTKFAHTDMDFLSN